MTDGLEFRAGERWLIAIPHPDDETVATGGLIQQLIAAGVTLRVLVATDGDNNPWPQRWLERRWRIDGEARARWGRRRRDEARAALAVLGVGESAIRFFGWPDQGLTDRLMDDALAEELLLAEIGEFRPSAIVAPALSDRHPDHSALRILVELALVRAGLQDCRKLDYVVHGRLPDGGSRVLPLAADELQTKQRALQAHATQLALSRRRMQAICDRPERYALETRPPSTAAPGHSIAWTMPWSRRSRLVHRHELLLVLAHGGRILRIRKPLDPHSGIGSITIESDPLPPVQVNIDVLPSALRIELNAPIDLQLIFAKIDRKSPRLVIYDFHGWAKIADSSPRDFEAG